VNTGPISLKGTAPVRPDPWLLEDAGWCLSLDALGETVLFILVHNPHSRFTDEWGYSISLGGVGPVLATDEYEHGVALEIAKRAAIARALSIVESLTAALEGAPK